MMRVSSIWESGEETLQQPRLPRMRPNLAADHRPGISKETPAIVDHIPGDHPAVNDLSTAGQFHFARDPPEDMNPAARFDLHISVDIAPNVELPAINDLNRANDRPPEGEVLIDNHIAVDRTPLFSHISLKSCLNVPGDYAAQEPAPQRVSAGNTGQRQGSGGRGRRQGFPL